MANEFVIKNGLICNGNFTLSGSINATSNTTASFGILGIGTTSPTYKLEVATSTLTDGFRIQRSGTSQFVLTGDGVMYWGTGANNGILTWDTGIATVGAQSGNTLTLFANGTEKVRIDTNGNLGIGTTSVQRKLHVEDGICIYW